jgi:hypothetical protein
MRQLFRIRGTGRLAVIATFLLWAVMILPFPRSLEGAGMPLTLALFALDVAMGIATGWLAFARSATLDERQAGLRDRAYRIAFRLVALGVIIMLFTIFVGSIVDSFTTSLSRPQPQQVLGARWIIGLLELLVATPTAVIAWLQHATAEDSGSTRSSRVPARWLPLIAVPGLALLWLFAIAAMPVRASTARDDALHGTSMAGATCGHFSGNREAAFGFGAQVRLDVEACWDGKHAFAFRLDPQADLTRCEVPPGTADFARITQLSCTERTDASGTMFYTVRAKVESGLASAVTRDVVMELDVTRDGKVLAFG